MKHGLSTVAICTALALFGCDGPSTPVAPDTPAAPGTPATLPATGAPPATATPAAPPTVPAFVGHAWTRTDDAAPRGALWIFLPDGTLLQDSCFETHRLSRWTSVADGTVRWNEDGAEIRATVVTATDDTLVLRLDLVGGAEERRLVRAAVPYVCPDFPR